MINREIKAIKLPKLKEGLYKSPISQFMQIAEEMGELSERLGQLTGETGKRKSVPKDVKERVIEEAMDVAQAAVELVFNLCDYPIIAEELHWEKMIERGYLE